MTQSFQRIMLLILIFLTGCERQPVPPLELKSFALHDIQGLFGGQAIWVSEDRTVIVQLVDRSDSDHTVLWEKRFQFSLSVEDWTEMERIAGATYLSEVESSDRPGVPEESRPRILAILKSGATINVSRWIKDKNPAFDSVYHFLRNRCRPVGELIHEGAFDWKWRPEGFASQ